MTRMLPTGLSQGAFTAALRAFEEVLGADWVTTDDAELAKYADPYPVGEDVAAGPAAVVCPDTVEHVQAIVRVANEHGVPLSPISAGKNNSS